MNARASLRKLGLTDTLIIAVRLGLLEFWQKALPGDAAVVSLLESSILESLHSESLPKWPQVVSILEQKLSAEPPAAPIAKLVEDYRLPLPLLLNLAIIGEVEASHIVNLVISELQHPDKNPRPTLHFLDALLECLFVETPGAGRIKKAVRAKRKLARARPLTVLDIAEQTLVHQQVLLLHGDGPLPLQRLALEPCFWSVLCGRPALWPGSRPLASDNGASLPRRARDEIKKIAPLLDANGASMARVSTLVLRGNPRSGRQQFAVELAEELNLRAVMIAVEIWRDRPAFAALCRYAGWLPVIQPEVAPGTSLSLPEHQRHTPLIVIMGTDGAVDTGNTIEVSLELPTIEERRRSWNRMLDDNRLSSELAASALLSDATITAVGGNALHLARQHNQPPSVDHVAEARQKLGAEKLRLLAQPVFRQVTAEALVMPPLVQQSLDALILRARKRESLWQGMGKTLQATPCPGVRALFVGESGTGKTLAASYVSTALTAPLYRVDLSAVMNKYIGESEKNLSLLLDQAAATDVVLLFDEADALFGSRSDGRETGERYANMLTNFLLTRIETHPGIVILTTNSSERIDAAFNRRIDAIVEFPLPGYEQRLRLWRSHLGDRGPGEQVYRSLASYCDLAGGQVRNVVLSAAVYAENEGITPQDLWLGLHTEYDKLGREIPGKLNFLRPESNLA